MISIRGVIIILFEKLCIIYYYCRDFINDKSGDYIKYEIFFSNLRKCIIIYLIGTILNVC